MNESIWQWQIRLLILAIFMLLDCRKDMLNLIIDSFFLLLRGEHPPPHLSFSFASF